jgi:Domain of unknown function (DUF4129)
MEPPETTRPPQRQRSTLRVLLLTAGMVAFLALVAAVSRAHHTPGSRAGVHSPPSGVGDYLFTIFLLLIVAMFLFMLWLWVANRDLLAQQRQRQQRGGMTRMLVFLMALALFAAVLSRLHKVPVVGGHLGSGKFHLGKPAKTLQKAQKQKGGQGGPQFEWLPVFIATAAGIAVLGFIGVRSVRRERRGLVKEHQLQLEFEELVEDTLADLYAEKDARKAIIAAYARVEQIFATYGLAREPSEAPVEYLERVLPELRASGAALGRLTNLFEWAKFSAHDVDGSMRDEAITALLEVRDELRANRLEQDIRKAQKPMFLPKEDPFDRTRGVRQ